MATTLASDTAAADAVAPPTDRARLALTIGATALALGVAGDVLVRGFEPGAGWAVALSLLLLAVGALAARRGGLTPEQRLMLVPIVFLAESFAWRDAGALHAINLFALFVSLAALSISLAADGAWTVMTAGFRGLIAACLHAVGTGIGGAVPLLFSDVDLRPAGASGRTRRLGAVGRGVLITLPVLLLFGSLLVSADPIVGRLVARNIDLDLGTVVSHVVVIGIFAWLTAGALRGALLGGPLVRDGLRLDVSIGRVEAGMLLGAVNALFLAFLLIQASYLFGGAEHLLATAGLTAAEYARGGFFELMFVAVLAIPLLLVTRGLLRADPSGLRLYGRLAGALALQVGVMLLSAGARMRLYVQGFGLTEDRLYASAIMLWLATVFAAFFVTVLRGRPERLGGTALVMGWLTLGALNVANPDVLIARVNLARAAEGRALDGGYLSRLGAGAVPLAVAAIPRLGANERCAVASGLLAKWGTDQGGDWRDWNKSRAEARALVQTRRAELEKHAGPAGARSTCGDVSGADAQAIAAAGERASGVARPWWYSGDVSALAARIKTDPPSRAASPRPTAAAEMEGARAAVREWFAAVSFVEGAAPDWPRAARVMERGATMSPPRAELPLPGTPPHGMLRVPLAVDVAIAGDVAQALAPYELRHAPDGGVVARGLAIVRLRRHGDGDWRLTSVAWSPDGVAAPSP